jgi:hypothetical protein
MKLFVFGINETSQEKVLRPLFEEKRKIIGILLVDTNDNSREEE